MGISQVVYTTKDKKKKQTNSAFASSENKLIEINVFLMTKATATAAVTADRIRVIVIDSRTKPSTTRKSNLFVCSLLVLLLLPAV